MPALPKHVVYATIEYIVQKHRELESSPVGVFDLMFDADERAEVRMKNACEMFDEIPLETGVVFTHLGTKMINWKDADNVSHPYTKEQLQNVFFELIKQRTIRATVLFGRLQYFKATVGTHSVNQINDLGYWGV